MVFLRWSFGDGEVERAPTLGFNRASPDGERKLGVDLNLPFTHSITWTLVRNPMLAGLDSNEPEIGSLCFSAIS